MLQVTENEIKNRLSFDNPWWEETGRILPYLDKMPRRDYCAPFLELVEDRQVNRAVVLMGPRRVGKTVMLQHTVQSLIDKGADPKAIFYVTIDNPAYSDISLEKILHMFQDTHGHLRRAENLWVIFDEIQYLKEWEVHLKVLVDSYPGVKFVASGSAAAALKLKSKESGAGRFTDFLLPPVNFAEFLKFRGVQNDLDNIDELNIHFVDYINYGGFPEAVFSVAVQQDMRRFIGSDVIDKVLLRDLPSLYGIANPQELNQFFSSLAYNTGNEVSLDELSKNSGVAKNTVRKYLEYLESAFLIHRLYRIDQNAKRFKRATHFKVYLTNPSLRAALFGAMEETHPHFGHAVETAVVAQYVQQSIIEQLHYARWKGGEVDLVLLDLLFNIAITIEIKWSDRAFANPTSELSSLISFVEKHSYKTAYVLVKTHRGSKEIGNLTIEFRPISMACRDIGRHIEKLLKEGTHPRRLLPELDELPSQD